MQSDNFLILPGVKGAVGWLAGIARIGLMLCAAAATGELLCLSCGFAVTGLISGILSWLILNLELVVLSMAAVWCHEVLLAERGYGFTRFLSLVALFYALSCPVCEVYTVCTGELLLPNQALHPLIVSMLLLLVQLTNLPNMEAAERRLKIRLGVFPVLLAGIFLAEQAGFILWSAIGKVLLVLLLARPLRQLADIAPRVISMPGRADSAHE